MAAVPPGGSAVPDRPDGGGPPFHVVVVSYRTPGLLDRCLTALAVDVAEGLARVTVVDNASGDGSADLVRDRHPTVELVKAGSNRGFGAAVNLGARGTRSAWVCAANADVAVEPGALRALGAAGDADPRAGVLAPRLVRPDGTTQHSVHPFPGLRFGLAFNAGAIQASPRLRRHFVLEGHWDADRSRRVPWAHGAFLAVRRAAWDDTGGFDPALWMYAEDLDLCWRARRAGWGTRYVPDAHVRHEGSAATAEAWGRQRGRRATAAALRRLARRRGPAVAGAVAAMNIAGSVARVAVGASPGRPAHRAWLREHVGAARDAVRPDPGHGGDDLPR